MSALVYDIGLHDGRDTGHYLREGSRVVAPDANPEMCAAAEANFRDYIRTGQLKVINRRIRVVDLVALGKHIQRTGLVVHFGNALKRPGDDRSLGSERTNELEG
jgi:hypothetical protein